MPLVRLLRWVQYSGGLRGKPHLWKLLVLRVGVMFLLPGVLSRGRGHGLLRRLADLFDVFVVPDDVLRQFELPVLPLVHARGRGGGVLLGHCGQLLHRRNELLLDSGRMHASDERCRHPHVHRHRDAV